MMRKRERENPCGVCGHYHKYEEGEVCGVCGHRVPVATEKSGLHISAFPSEILPEFLYLGSYDHASRVELLKAQGISRILNEFLRGICILTSLTYKLTARNFKNPPKLHLFRHLKGFYLLHLLTVPACQNLYKHSFNYHCLQEDKVLSFDDAITFLDQCEKDKARVLVHCMTGRSRSPAIVIAYLMNCKRWRLTQSYQWVKERRPSVKLSPGANQQLQEYEVKLFGSVESSPLIVSPGSDTPSGFGFLKNEEASLVPAFGNLTTNSIFDDAEFTFGAGGIDKILKNPLGGTPTNENNGQMES